MSNKPRFSARVNGSAGIVRNFVGAKQENGKLVGVTKLPDPDYLVIEEGDGGYYIFFFVDGETRCFADDWYVTKEEAKGMALRAFYVTETDWQID